METINAYPLTWPQNFPRSAGREESKFKTSLAAALKNVREELGRFAKDSKKQLDNVVISSNVSLGHDKPKDPGVAVWFIWDGIQVCIAVDRYLKVEDNLQAIYHIIDARRTELRHGGLAIVRATFTGFKALPSSDPRGWWDILGVPRSATEEQIKKASRELSKRYHPDGSAPDREMFEKIMKAEKEGLSQLK